MLFVFVLKFTKTKITKDVLQDLILLLSAGWVFNVAMVSLLYNRAVLKSPMIAIKTLKKTKQVFVNKEFDTDITDVKVMRLISLHCTYPSGLLFSKNKKPQCC